MGSSKLWNIAEETRDAGTILDHDLKFLFLFRSDFSLSPLFNLAYLGGLSEHETSSVARALSKLLLPPLPPPLLLPRGRGAWAVQRWRGAPLSVNLPLDGPGIIWATNFFPASLSVFMVQLCSCFLALDSSRRGRPCRIGCCAEVIDAHVPLSRSLSLSLSPRA